MTRAEAEMWMPGTVLVTTALLFRLKRKRWAWMLQSVPGGLLRSEYKGAAYDLRWWLMEVAQLSRPRQDCRAFLSAFLQARRACICSASLASLSGSRLTVSERKLKLPATPD